MKKLLFASLVVFGALTMPSCGEKKAESTDTDTAAVVAPMEEAPVVADTTTQADTTTHADTAATAPAH